MGDFVIEKKENEYKRGACIVFLAIPSFKTSAALPPMYLMDLRLTLLLLVLFHCIAQVPSETKIEEQQHGQVVKGGTRRLFQFVDCGELCRARCSLHSRQNVCKRACGTCCARCKCVPPGTSGNRERCGRCYTDMRTHGNKFKCP